MEIRCGAFDQRTLEAYMVNSLYIFEANRNIVVEEEELRSPLTTYCRAQWITPLAVQLLHNLYSFPSALTEAITQVVTSGQSSSSTSNSMNKYRLQC